MNLKLVILTLVTSFLVKTSNAFVLDALNNQHTTDECSDALSTCDLIDPTFYCVGDYYIWALDNCVKTCNLCHVTPTEETKTTPTPVGCKSHGETYSQGEYWTVGCLYNCTCVNGSTGDYECMTLCPFYEYLPPGVHLVKPLGECCSKPDIELQNIDQYVWHQPFPDYAANKCIHNNQIYKEGEWWKEGCNRTCECNGYDNNYSCGSVCLEWSTLPSICHMDDIPQGLCCEQPRCPSGIVITIPNRYKDEYPGYTYV